MSASPIMVVSCADAKFLPYVGAVAASIGRSTSAPVDYLVFYDGPESVDTEALDGFAIGSVRVTLRRAPDWIARYGTVDGYPPVTVLRLRLQDELPELDSIIYLDGDVLVRRDLSDLAKVEMGDAPIAAVVDRAYQLSPRAVARPVDTSPAYDAQRCIAEITGLARSGPGEYINSGVLRMNLAALRNEGFGARSELILAKWNKLLRYRDQDVFNIALQGRIRHLDPAWNALVGVMLKSPRRIPSDLRDEIEAERWNPAIVHFAGSRKPWLTAKPLPFAGAWWHFARQSPTISTIEARYQARMAVERRSPNVARWLAITGALRYLRWSGAQLARPQMREGHANG